MAKNGNSENRMDFNEWLNSIRGNMNPSEEEIAHDNHMCTGIMTCNFCKAEAEFDAFGLN